MQRWVSHKLEIVKKLEDGETKRAEVERRLAQQKREQTAAREEKRKARNNKMDRRNEAIMKCRVQQRDASRELMSKLEGSFDKVNALLKSKAETWEQIREERHHRLEGAAERRQQAEQTAQAELVRLYLEKEQRFRDHLEEEKEKTRSKASAEDSKYSQKMELVSTMLENKQAEKEAAFKKVSEALERASEVVREKNEERSKVARETIEKRMLKKDERLLQHRKERYERRKEIMDKLAAQDAMTPRELRAEETQRRIENRAIMEEVVEQNLQRLERAHEFAREQMLARIQQNAARVDIMTEQRHKHMLQRTQLLRETMLGRCNAQETIRTMKALPKPDEPHPVEESK